MSALEAHLAFIFSDSNISKDRGLRTLLAGGRMRAAPDGALPAGCGLRAPELLAFPRVHQLAGGNLSALKHAAARVPGLAFSSEDGGFISRARPWQPPPPGFYDTRTVYAEGVPPGASLHHLAAWFSQWGPVAHVSLPRWMAPAGGGPRRSAPGTGSAPPAAEGGPHKGFAFVEFEAVEGAAAAVAAARGMARGGDGCGEEGTGAGAGDIDGGFGSEGAGGGGGAGVGGATSAPPEIAAPAASLQGSLRSMRVMSKATWAAFKAALKAAAGAPAADAGPASPPTAPPGTLQASPLPARAPAPPPAPPSGCLLRIDGIHAGLPFATLRALVDCPVRAQFVDAPELFANGALPATVVNSGAPGAARGGRSWARRCRAAAGRAALAAGASALPAVLPRAPFSAAPSAPSPPAPPAVSGRPPPPPPSSPPPPPPSSPPPPPPPPLPPRPALSPSLENAERIASGAAPPLVSAAVRYAAAEHAAAAAAHINAGVALLGHVVRARVLVGGEEAAYWRVVDAQREAYAVGKLGAPVGKKRGLGGAGGVGDDSHARPEKRSRAGV